MSRSARFVSQPWTFLRDEAGAVLVLWIMSLVAVLGLVALVIDLGRVQVAHGELQSFADSVALAAAGELDGSANAIARATAAAAEVADTVAYGSDTVLSGAGDYTLTFLNSLPASDTTTLPSSMVTTADGDAAYVRVQVTPATFSVNFLAATRALVGAANNDASVTAEAIAGFTLEACDVTPLMFCVPDANWQAKNNIGQNIILRSGGNGASWFPGAFGFLQLASGAIGPACSGIPSNNKPKTIGCVLGAETNKTQCFSQRSVNVEPGQSSGLFNDVFNIRFDRYPGDLKGYEGNSNFPAAPNIVSGEKVNCSNWKVDPSTNSVGLPNDICIDSGSGCSGYTCGSAGDPCYRFGDGDWSSDDDGDGNTRLDEYIDYNYGNRNGVLDSGEDVITSYIPSAWAGKRYGLYLGEIEYAKSLNGGSPGPFLTGRDETGYAQCSGVASTDPERRVVIAAAINCSAFASDTSNNPKTNLPVKEFVKMFMLGPVGAGTGSPPGFDISVEVVGSAGTSGYGSAGTGGVFHDVVQLYR